MTDRGEITVLLGHWADGDEHALEQLTPLVYDELRRIARRLFAGERGMKTLQPTAIVHEAFQKLVDVDVSWQDRAHFFALAARMMRRLLINNANANRAQKRGGDAARVTYLEGQLGADEADTQLLELDEALTALSQLEPKLAELVELQYFGGLTFREMEAVTGLSSTTIDRHLRLARAWLRNHLES